VCVCLSGCTDLALTCLPLCPSACLSVCLPTCMSVCLSACLPVCRSVCLSLSVLRARKWSKDYSDTEYTKKLLLAVVNAQTSQNNHPMSTWKSIYIRCTVIVYTDWTKCGHRAELGTVHSVHTVCTVHSPGMVKDRTTTSKFYGVVKVRSCVPKKAYS
jgi:hypothetical protein